MIPRWVGVCVSVCVCGEATSSTLGPVFSCVQARGVMGEWLKELSLFDHLLHGLFKFIGETTSVSGRKEELEGTYVTLSS